MKCYAYDNEIEGATELYWCETEQGVLCFYCLRKMEEDNDND